MSAKTRPKPAETSLLPGRSARAVAALLATSSLAEAAREAGISERSLRRWLSRDDFRAELRRAEAEAIAQSARLLAGRAARAVEVLCEVQEDLTAPPGIRLRAAVAILEHVARLRELALIEERLRAVELMLMELRDAQDATRPAGGH